MKLCGQAMEGFFFTVLFGLGGPALRILDEVGGDGDRQAVGGQPFGLQHRMVEERSPVGQLTGQAVRAVALVKGEHPGSIDGNEEPALQSEIVERFHADESTDRALNQFRYRPSRDAAEPAGQGVAMGDGFFMGSGQTDQIGDHRGTAAFEGELQAAAQMEQEHQQTGPHQVAAGVVEQVRVPVLRQLVQPTIKVREEVADRPGQLARQVRSRALDRDRAPRRSGT